MEFNPLDIRYQEFKRKMRGYDPAEVRAYLEELADYVGRLEEELKTCREAKEKLEREAELIRAEAEADKEKILREAADHLRAMRRELDELKRQREMFKEQFRGLLNSYLKNLD